MFSSSEHSSSLFSPLTNDLNTTDALVYEYATTQYSWGTIEYVGVFLGGEVPTPTAATLPKKDAKSRDKGH